MSDIKAALLRVEEWQADATRAKIMTRPRLSGYLNELARGEHSGYHWYVAHNDMGFRTGYIRVGRRHPWFLKEYGVLDVDVHGGLTYAEKGPPGKVPKFSYQWWLGFDCGHAWDAPDPELISPRTMAMYERTKELSGGKVDMMRTLSMDNIIRTQEYAEMECVSLCVQATEAMNNAD